MGAGKCTPTRFDSKLIAMGKDERAISVSVYVHRGMVNYTDRAFEKTALYKRTHEITWSTKSRAFASATEEATVRTTFSRPSATASLWLSG